MIDDGNEAAEGGSASSAAVAGSVVSRGGGDASSKLKVKQLCDRLAYSNKKAATTSEEDASMKRLAHGLKEDLD